MSLQLVIVSVLAGTTLGLRYKIVMLIRGVALVLMFATMVGIANRDPFLLIILVMAISATGIQLSYLVRIYIRGACNKWPELVPHRVGYCLERHHGT